MAVEKETEGDAEIAEKEAGKETDFGTENGVGKIAEERTEIGAKEVGKLCSERRAENLGSKCREDLKGKICGSEAGKSSSSKVLGKPPEIAETVEISEIAEKAEIVEILLQEIAPQEKATQEISHRTSSFSGSHLPTISSASFLYFLTASTLYCGFVSFLLPVLQLFFEGHLKTQLLLMFPTRLPQLQ